MIPGSFPRRRTGVVVALLALLATLVAPGTARAADANAEAAFVAAVNQERAAAGLPALAVAEDLVAVARRHAVVMADAEHLHHNPDLAGQVGGWQKVGENVGRGPSVAPIQEAFMASPAHRANVLDPEWTEVGLGVEARDGRLWVVEVFRQPAAAVAPPAVEPAAAPEATEPESARPAATEATEEEPTEPAPAAEDDRALVMLTRVAAEDAALDAL